MKIIFKLIFQKLENLIIICNITQIDIQSQVRIDLNNYQMTSLQLKHGFGKTASGSLNKKQQDGKFKQILITNYDDVEMISPLFLQSKTLKKPLTNYGFRFSKYSQNFIKPENDKTQKNPIASNLSFEPQKNVEDLSSNLQKTQKIDYTLIALDKTSHIKPAYKPVQQNLTVQQQRTINDIDFSLDANNTIFSAILKKGSQPKKSISFVDKNQKTTESRPAEVQRKVGKAQSKLKQLFNKNVTKLSNFGLSDVKKTQNKKMSQSEDIEEEIQQSINEYADDGFQNYSGESAIKQSIRDQFAASSGSGIKQSIREEFGNSSYGKQRKSQIMEEIQESIRASISGGKQQIPEFIGSYKSSKSNIREQIRESLSGSKKSAQQVYEQIFEEYDDSLKNSRSAFKKSGSFKEKEDVLSKSFRKKTNVVKSIKLAEEIMNQHKIDANEEFKNKKEDLNKYTQKLVQQKKEIMKKKADLSELFNKKNQPYQVPDKNKNLFYEFKIELNKLLTSQNFQSKLRKLTSFINFGENSTINTINSLEKKILGNILEQINEIKKSADSEQIQKLKAEYDQKLNIMLKDQEINLRVQMEKKLHQKDMQIKKMIAELEKKFQGKAFASAGAKINNFIGNQNSFQGNNSALYEGESDYSIDSDNVSWKADLWEVLPDYQKKKLYEKQTKEVTNFLTEIMINELKEESLCRDLDISFEFPAEFNDSSQKISSFPFLGGTKRVLSTEDFMPKLAFNRKEFEQNISVNHHQQSPKKQSVFPDFPRPKINVSQDFDFKSKQKQNVNQYSKIEGEIVPESTKKLRIQKQKIFQVLSKYKSSYIRKKNDAIRKILKTLKPKDIKKAPEQILSVIQQITILSKEDVNPSDMVYIRAYEEELVWALVSIISKNQNKKAQIIEEQMRKNYERLTVICQAKVAQNAEEVVCLDIYQQNKKLAELKGNTTAMSVKPCPLQIPIKQQAVDIIQKKQEKKIKNQLVDNIINILMMEFAKDFPKRKK